MDTVTQQDIDEANDGRLRALALLGRIAGWVVLVIGVAAALSWIWLEVRTQQHGQGIRFGFDDGDKPRFIERVDMFTANVYLVVFSGVAFAVGAGLLLASSHLYARTGESLHGAAVGDLIPEELDDDLGGSQRPPRVEVQEPMIDEDELDRRWGDRDPGA